MKAISYVSFNGNCQEAIDFYHSVLGGQLEVLRYKDMPVDEDMPISDNWKDKVMHASLSLGDGCFLYFGDTWEEATVDFGNNITIHLQFDAEEEVHTVFNKLSVNGQVTMPVGRTFWNSVYGSFIDQFGISWGLEFELNK